MKSDKYWEHVWLAGGFRVTNSIGEQATSRCPTPVRLNECVLN